LGTILEGLDAQTQKTRLEKNWDKYKSSPKMPIFKALAQTYKREFLFAFFINFLVVICSISSPILVSKIVTFMETPSGEDGGMWLGITYLAAFIFLGTAANVLDEQANFYQGILGDKAYASLTATIYHKTLKVSPSTNKQFEQGEIVNFIQVDAEKACEIAWWFPPVARLPIQLIFCLAFLFYHFKYYLFVGFGIAIVTIVFNYYVAIYNSKKDERMNTTTEVISSMKIIKLNSWIRYFVDKVTFRRNRELKIIKKSLLVNCLEIITAFFFSPSLMIVTFSVYFLCGNTMSLGNAFACMQVLFAIDDPIRWIPQFIGILMEFLVSMRRIQKFLLWDEINTELVQTCNEDLKKQNIDILISHANFSWGGKKKKSEDDDEEDRDEKQDKKNKKSKSKEKSSKGTHTCQNFLGYFQPIICCNSKNIFKIESRIFYSNLLDGKW
jgi:ABC-type multidrug transport system fused ATPase/permease subunit